MTTIPPGGCPEPIDDRTPRAVVAEAELVCRAVLPDAHLLAGSRTGFLVQAVDLGRSRSWTG